jgi:diguanylate cyclase (GGDEF)-like protein
VLAREAELAEAMAVAERLRQLVEVAQTRWESGHDVPVGITVTVSVGVAQLGEDETERDLFEAADQAVYKAKKNGRNRVLAAGTRTPKPRRRQKR